MSPLEHIRADSLMCEWDPAPLLLFSSEVEPIVYYSHLFPAAAVMVLATVVLWRNSRRLTAKIFSFVAFCFFLFAIFDVILWATEQPSLIMFLWSLLTYIEPLIYLGMAYLVLVIAYGKDLSTPSKYIAAVLMLPVILLGPTSLNLEAFDYTNCWRLAVEGQLLYYVYGVEIAVVLWMIIGSIDAIRKTADPDRRKTLIYLLAGSLLFLLSFSSGNIFGTLLQDVMGEDAWIVGQYGLFGMPIFLALVMYLMVKYELFAARVIYAEALMLGVGISLLSLLFIPNIQTARPIIVITIILTSILGYFLVTGVRNDLEQKDRIEKLASRLEAANARLKTVDKLKSEFVSIASHQLRSPLTSIRGYSSMLLEGSFGNFPQKAKEPLERIEHSARVMALSIEDYLNVSRIESGNMKYERSDFNLKEVTESIVDDLRAEATKSGLLLSFKSDVSSKCIVNADEGKVQQVIHNLLNNALKYTPKGSVTVFLHDDTSKKEIHVEVIDTGIGMDPNELPHLFEKFERAKNANSVNTTGTGLGLYVAQQMAQAMGGDVTGYSEGPGKGSHFILTLPLAM